jgi:hypothetical protein
MGHYSEANHFNHIYFIIHDSYKYISFPVMENSHRVSSAACQEFLASIGYRASGIVDSAKSFVHQFCARVCTVQFLFGKEDVET